MTKLVLKVISTGEHITVTDDQYQDIITKGNLRFYEICERVEEKKVEVPASVKKELDKDK